MAFPTVILRALASCAALSAVFVACAAAAPIIPPTGRFPDWVLQLIQRDPSQFEFQHAWIAETERLRQNRLRIERGELTPRDEDERRRLTVVQGTRKVPVFLVKYSNTGADPIDAADLQQELFDGPWPTGTMTEYYNEISYGNLTLDGTVFDWVTASNTDAYYAGEVSGLNPSLSHTGALVREVVAANDAAVDFSQYDNNGPDNLPNSGDDDGYVDFVAVVHPEVGGECGPPDNLWSQRASLSGWDGDGGIYTTNDAKFGGGFIQVADFTIMPALSCDFPPGMTAIGVFCHEFGHAFGLPDLYDLSTDGSSCETDFSEGVGYWCLMGAGNWNTPERPAHMSVWSKSYLGWITPTVVTADLNNWPILSSTRVPVAFKMWDQGAPGLEYFLVERRTADGFDDHIHAPGILIWHLDENNTAGNSNECHPSIDLECADQTGPDHTLDHDDLAEGDNKGDAGDPFCDGDAFTSASLPSSVSYSGAATAVQVKDIHGCGDVTATADLLVGASAGSNDVCLRDCGSDVCSEPSPCDVFWKSPEVYIDNNDDGIIDAPAPGLENHLFARVRNIGADNADNVTVDFYYADPHIGVNFPSQGMLIDSDDLSAIGPGSSDVADVMWTIPNPPPGVDHYCVGVVAQNALDGQTSEDARADDNVAQINLQALYAKAGDNVPVAASPPAVVFDTTRIVTLCNNSRTTCSMKVRIGSPPLYDDAFIPSDWTVTIMPTTVTLAPGQCVPVTVHVQDTNAIHGDYAVIPLTGLCGTTPRGGDFLEFHIDNVAPKPPCTFTVTETPHGDHFPGAGGLKIEWDTSLEDELGFGESVERWRIYRGSSAAFVPSPANLFVETCLDDDPLTSRYQHFEDLPEDTLRSWYKMVAEDRAGNVSDTCVTHVQYTLTGVSEGDGASAAPVVLLLNAPSPFRSTATIHYVLPAPGAVELAVFGPTGRLVRVLARETQIGGAHDVVWDGRDAQGDRVPAGAYFVRLSYGGRYHAGRLALAR